MTQEAFASIIYNNFLFDIPKILDLCVLYKENPVLSKIVQNLFSAQKNYFQDFKACMRDIMRAVETSKKKLRSIFELDGMYNFNENFSNKIILDYIYTLLALTFTALDSNKHKLNK